ncbi:MAG: hypothetical protein QXP58_04310, partial [Thermoprotei archaeon]
MGATRHVHASTPQSPLATTTTSVAPFECVALCYFTYSLNWVVYYPSNGSFGPIPLIEAEASQVYSSGLSQYITGDVEAYIQNAQSSTLSLDVSEGDDFSGTSYQILGVSLTLSSSTL